MKWIAGLCLSAVLFTTAAHSQSVVLVRHGEKAPNGGLAPEGRARAQRLAKMLGESKVKKIYSTRTVRTQATAAPLALSLGFIVEPYEDAIDLTTKLEKDLATLAASELILVVGHSDTVPATINRLMPAQPLLADLPENDFSSFFVVSGKSDRSLLRMKY